MKILFLTHYFPPEVNAPANRTYDHAVRWVRAGHSVTVITCTPNCPDGVVYNGYRNRLFGRERVDGIDVIRVWTFIAANKGTVKRILNYLSYSFSAIFTGLLLRRRDVIVATSPQFFCGVAGMILQALKRVPFILEIRDIWPESITAVGAMKTGLGIWALEALEKVMYRAADRIVAVGNGYRDRIAEKGIPEDDIDVVYNGIDTDTFRALPDERDRYRRRFNAGNDLIITYIGTVGMAHGLDILIRAAVKAADEKWQFWVFGSGARRDELTAAANELGLNNVKFWGMIPKHEVPGAWGASDIAFIHLKGSDLFRTVIPSKMFEAMAMEKPIILGVQGEAAAILKDSGCGIAIVPGDEDDLIRTVRSLVAERGELAARGVRGKEYVQAEFSRNALASQFLGIIEMVVAKGGS